MDGHLRNLLQRVYLVLHRGGIIVALNVLQFQEVPI